MKVQIRHDELQRMKLADDLIFSLFAILSSKVKKF